MELRKWSYEDAAGNARYANNKKIADNLRDVFPYPYTVEDAMQFITHCLNTPEDRLLNRAIVYNGQAVGSIGLTFGEDIYAKSAEIGY